MNCMMGESYASVADIIALARPLDQEELERAAALIPVVCARLRTEAKRYGLDLDEMVAGDPDLSVTARSVVVDIVVRCLASPMDQSSVMTQVSEAALGYSISGTLANPGGGIFIKRAELAALGIRRQRVGVLEFYGDD